MRFLEHVVRDEDYATGLRIQRALESGALTDVLFGRNEWGGQRFHRFVEALLAAEDAELPAFFAAGVGVMADTRISLASPGRRRGPASTFRSTLAAKVPCGWRSSDERPRRSATVDRGCIAGG